MMYTLHDETKPLNTVFVHKPGLECKVAVEAEDSTTWLFDESLKGANSSEWLMEAQKEHDGLVGIIKGQGVQVKYLTDLLQAQKQALKAVLETAIQSALHFGLVAHDDANEFWKAVEADAVAAALQGIKLPFECYEKLDAAGLPVLIPKPNAYFAQDPFAVIGNYFVELKPAKWQRSGEPQLWKMALQPSPQRYIKMDNTIEGGDVTVWNGKVFVGVGQRTVVEAAKELAKYKLGYKYLGDLDIIEKDWDIVVVQKPDEVMHLDNIMMPLASGTVLGNVGLMKKSKIIQPEHHNGESLHYYLTSTPYKLGMEGSFFAPHTILPAHPTEQHSLAPNVLPLNGGVISASNNVKTNSRLEMYYVVHAFEAKTLLLGLGLAHYVVNAANEAALLVPA